MQFYSCARWFSIFTCVMLITACGGGGDSSNQAPVATFTASVLGTTAGAIRFNASGSADPDGQVVDYSWDFGDGQTGQGQVVDHVYTATGTYLVTLVVTDNGGAKTSKSQNVDTVSSEVVSGTIKAAVGMMVDSDINTTTASYISNNTPETAQVIPNPVLLGGYANKASTGALGRSRIQGDESDFFRVDLTAGQTITLNIANHHNGDLDLFLYQDDGSIDVLNPDDASVEIGQTESLTVATAGSYLIEVYVFRGYSNYNLVIGQDIISAGVGSLRLSDDFVPGELIVQMNEEVSARSFKSDTLTSMGLVAKAGGAGRPMLVTLGDTAQQRQATLRSLGAVSATPRRFFQMQDQTRQMKLETLLAIKTLRQRKDVRYAEPNYVLKAFKTPLDAEYDKQWHYRTINLPTAWDVSTGSPSVIVAVIDTGVLLDHPDLAGQFSTDMGYDFIRNDESSDDGEPGIDNNPDDPGDSGGFGDSSFHGTHVAGTVAAKTNFDVASSNSGVAGVAPNVKIMPLRVLGAFGGTLYDINQALLYAAGLANDSGTVPAQRADVINMSLGGGGFSQTSQNVINQVRAAGSIVVAAAGNEASGVPSYPASYDGVISVSAVDLSNNLAPYSNFGSAVDVAAPGGDTGKDDNGDGNPDGVLSTAGDDSGGTIVNNYKIFQGTSMAAPHVAGVIALMKSVYGDLTPAQVDSLLSTGDLSRDLGDSGRDDSFGYGLIDAAKAIAAAQTLAGNGGALPPRLYVVPEALNLGFVRSSAQLILSNAGADDLTISSISSDSAWLTVTEENVDESSKLGVYRLTADRPSLAVGTHRAVLTLVSSVNSVTVPVILQIADGSVSDDAGDQFVLLIDSETNKVVDEQAGSFVDGELAFSFANVSFTNGRRYSIFSGSDMNNDDFICDAGESCGAYLVLDSPVEITQDSQLTGLSFFSGFDMSLALQSIAVDSSKSKKTR